MSGRPSLISLGASVVAHGGLLALLFFVFVSDESFSNPLIIDLSSLETTTESVSKPGPRTERPAAGPRRGPKGAGAEKPVERIAAAPAPASPAPVVTPEPAPAPEPVRPPEREVSKPEPAPVGAATSEPAQSAAPSTAPSPAAGTNPAATGGSSADGAAGRTTSSDGASGGSGSRVALALGGGGEPGAEYGGYLAGVRRRIQESLQYPASARRRGIKGTVNLEILIRADGAISSVSVARSSSHSELDEAAVEAVRSLARHPFPAGLRPRPLRVTLPIVFDLQ
jgi:periplasmic protein TonB